MLKFFVSFFILIASIGLFAITKKWHKSTGAPASNTLAPGEQTCNTVGCHDDNSLNLGNALISVENGNMMQYYKSGFSQNIEVNIHEEGFNAFGFQLTALDTLGKRAGTFLLTDTERTQIVSNDLELTDRQYLTYTYPGTIPISPGANKWNFVWKSDSNYQGNVNFYLACVSANGDGTDKNDYVYTKSFKLEHSESASSFLMNASQSTNVFFDASRRMLSINAPKKVTSIMISDANGKCYLNSQTNVKRQLECDAGVFPNGLYYIVLCDEKWQQQVFKVIIY